MSLKTIFKKGDLVRYYKSENNCSDWIFFIERVEHHYDIGESVVLLDTGSYIFKDLFVNINYLKLISTILRENNE